MLNPTNSSVHFVLQKYKEANQGKVAPQRGVPDGIDIECKGLVPQMAWRMSDKIKHWGITWKDSTLPNPDVSLGINGNLGGCNDVLRNDIASTDPSRQ